MKKMKKAAKWMAGVTAFAGSLLLLGAVDSHRNAARCDDLVVNVGEVPNALIDADAVRLTLKEYDGPLVGKPLMDIHASKLESELLAQPYVAEVSIYKTIDHKLVVDIEPREATVRLLDRNGRAALLDTRGCLIPVSKTTHLRLPVITGNFDLDPEAVAHCAPISELIESPEDDLERIRMFSAVAFADPFWKAQLQHTHLKANGDFVSVARVGGHLINFGKGRDIEQKLEALDILYREGLDESTWNRYAAINLKYENQIICTEKH